MRYTQKKPLWILTPLHKDNGIDGYRLYEDIDGWQSDHRNYFPIRGRNTIIPVQV